MNMYELKSRSKVIYEEHGMEAAFFFIMGVLAEVLPPIPTEDVLNSAECVTPNRVTPNQVLQIFRSQPPEVWLVQADIAGLIKINYDREVTRNKLYGQLLTLVNKKILEYKKEGRVNHYHILKEHYGKFRYQTGLPNH